MPKLIEDDGQSIQARLDFEVPDSSVSSLQELSDILTELKTSYEATAKFSQQTVKQTRTILKLQKQLNKIQGEHFDLMSDEFTSSFDPTTVPEGRYTNESSAQNTKGMSSAIQVYDVLKQKGLTSIDDLRAAQVPGSEQVDSVEGLLQLISSDPVAFEEVSGSLDQLREGESGSTLDKISTLGRDFRLATQVGASKDIPTALSRGGKFFQGLSSSGVGGVAKLGAKAVPVLGIAATVAEVVQKGLETYRGFEEEGLIQGQGAMQGFSDDFGARMMSLNPWISYDDAKAMSRSLRENSYSGELYDEGMGVMGGAKSRWNMDTRSVQDLMDQFIKENGASMKEIGRAHV